MAFNEKQLFDKGVIGKSITGKTDAPVVQFVKRFPFQSYFDATLGPRAILDQPRGQQIVPSTKTQQAISGYAIGLHPASQTPIAVRFQKGAQAGDSGVVIIKPGQVVRPSGESNGGDGRFSGFEYGLPFGWLGGGNVTIYVFRTADAKVSWIDRNEVIFHRQRMPIIQPANMPLSTALTPNWPVAFPWESALRGTNSVPQDGENATISVTPTRVAMRLILDTLVNPVTMRATLAGSTEFGELSTGVEDLLNSVSYDIVWGSWTSSGGGSYTNQYQFQFLPAEMFMLSSRTGQLILTDMSGTAALNGAYVDVIRYGVL